MRVRSKRSRGGCRNCKRSKIKCDEKKPKCSHCIRKGRDDCTYSLILRWSKKPPKTLKSSKSESQKTPLGEDVNVTRPNDTSADIAAIMPSSLIPNDTGIEQLSWSSGYEIPNNLGLDDKPQRSKGTYFQIPLSPFSFDTPFNGHNESLRNLGLPGPRTLELSHPSPSILSNSPYFSELFGFFLRETSRLLVPVPSYAYRSNPFHTLIPQMAMQSPPLMGLILAFGANHRNKMISYQEQCTFPSLDEKVSSKNIDGLLADELLSSTISQLLVQLMNAEERRSDTTLATILMLAGFDIFFCDTRNKWRAHILGAKRLLIDRLSSKLGPQSKTFKIPSANNVSNTETFLIHWFSYLNIIASLSSASPKNVIEASRGVSHEFSYEDNSDHAHELRSQLRDIDYFTGVDTKVLSLLAGVSCLIEEKRLIEQPSGVHDLILRALELDHEIRSYLEASETARDQVEFQILGEGASSNIKLKFQTYRTMRATNLIFGLTGVVQLKRRVIGIPQNSKILKDLLAEVTALIDKDIPHNSSAESCITFCLFCCGCELIDENLACYRQIYTERIEILLRRGVTSALQAKSIMKECWREKKSWWEILEEKNLDLTFAI
ncbi:LAQU0S09e04412g1_1 [Lachancea quebecensis]|uniref:LAQU0S09e04412g1_1 n=1 Tax=Lachancea quebecensis TaxID=1654605 RepID=A0A0P1KVZ0_9SACH|nr:LAQU0S09e04412g1_1 [Lachancea quebecensis]